MTPLQPSYQLLSCVDFTVSRSRSNIGSSDRITVPSACTPSSAVVELCQTTTWSVRRKLNTINISLNPWYEPLRPRALAHDSLPPVSASGMHAILDSGLVFRGHLALDPVVRLHERTDGQTVEGDSKAPNKMPGAGAKAPAEAAAAATAQHRSATRKCHLIRRKTVQLIELWVINRPAIVSPCMRARYSRFTYWLIGWLARHAGTFGPLGQIWSRSTVYGIGSI